MKTYAYAKVNLALKVISKREDGYHNISSVLDLIDIYDVLDFKEGIKVTIKCINANINLEDNLIYKAIIKLKEAFPECKDKGIFITLTKNIPFGAGLGGGSSDAATTILALNRIWGLNKSFEELVNVAIKVGSDVPFFLLRSRGIINGIGDSVTPIESDTKLYYILIYPGYESSTKKVYENNKIIGKDIDNLNIMINAFYLNDKSTIIDTSFNDLTDAACTICVNEPRIDYIINDMNNFFANNNIYAKAIMSGSGSTVACMFLNKKDVNKTTGYLKHTDYSYQKTSSIL